MKKVLSLLVSVLLIFTCVTTCTYADTASAAKPVMTDVNYETEIGKSIKKLVDAGIINGIPEPDGTYTYRAQNSVTRAEFCKMVNITFGYNTPAENIFTDISAENWYYSHALIAIKEGYIKGYGDGRFHGEDTITREQVCTILSRIVKTPTESTAEITDTVSDWAKEAVLNMIALGHISLEEGGKFRATENMTRGELAGALDGFVKEETGKNQEPPKTEDTKKDESDDGFFINPVQSNTSASSGSINTGSSGGSNRKPSNNNNKDDNDGSGNQGGNEGGNQGGNEEDNTTQKPTYTEEELIDSEEIYGLLEMVLEVVELNGDMVTFDEKGARVFELLMNGVSEVYALQDEGIVISNTYVRSVYAESAQEIRNIVQGDGTDEYPGMTDEEKEAFKSALINLNAGAFLQLAQIFNVNFDGLGISPY